MLKVYLGKFHPDLEDALYKKISALKSDDPLSPVAIIVPSDRIRSRIKILLTGERGLNLMATHFLTFHSLTIRLHEERYGLLKNLIGDDFFFTEFLRHIIKLNPSGIDIFRPFSETPEGCATLWRTLQDLKDARVEPDNVIEAIREGVFSTEDTEKLIPLILLYKEFLLRKKDLGIIDYSDLPEIATELVPTSRYLQSFKEIIYYGFYDVTQVQYDLFRSIATYYPTALYFNLIEDMPAFSFARRFFEGYIQGIVHDHEKVISLSDPVLTRSARSGNTTLFPFGHLSTIISASGAEDEVLAVAKVILRLVDREGYSFTDIGVVAREIDDYGHLIKRIFETHKIPFISSAVEPISRYQVTKTVHLLISINEENYRRSDIIELVSSHYCKIKSFCPDGVDPRPDLWDIVTRSIGITKGINEWDKLDRYVRDGIVLPENENADEEESGEGIVVQSVQIKGLRRFVASLKDDFASLLGRSSWSDYVETFRIIIQKYIDIEGFIDETLLSLKEFKIIADEVTLSEFIDALMHRLESKYIPAGDENISGVQVLDAMAARGIPFKVLFVLGMNEKVFPRNIREDPLLRDSARRILESGLGYKITEKLYGYEEEKLLFYLLLSSAGEKIYILYQRTDEAGQIKVPSWYLTEIKKSYPIKETKVPRRRADKFMLADLFDYPLLTPGEMSLRFILEGRDPWAIISGFNLNPRLYKHGFNSIGILEDMKPELTDLDGLTGPLNNYWFDLLQRGISPTSLEMYARCPFSYFARHIINLRRLKRPEEFSDIPPADIGNICHMILKRFYMRRPDIKTSDREIEKYLLENTTIVFREYREKNPVGYPLLWEVLQDKLLVTLKRLIRDNLRDIDSSQFIPYGFEVEATGFFPRDVIEYTGDLCVHGVLDRIDIKSDSGRFRIIDYKFRSGKKLRSDDRNLSLSAVRGKSLQPPLYLLMAIPYLKSTCGIENPTPEKVSFYFIAPNLSDNEDKETISDFPGNCWDSSLCEQIKATLVLLLNGIKEGLFFIYPAEYCNYCDYSTSCRKNHFPSHWRAERDSRVSPYHTIRQEKVKNHS